MSEWGLSNDNIKILQKTFNGLTLYNSFNFGTWFTLQITGDKLYQKKVLDEIFIKKEETYAIIGERIQCLFNEYLIYVKTNFVDDVDYIMKYTIKLHEIGMRFFWCHLLTYNNDIFFENFMDKYNKKLIEFGIENPNKKLFYCEFIKGSRKPWYPLIQPYVAVKYFDWMSMPGEILNPYEAYKDIKLYLQIGCDPLFDTGNNYDASWYPSRLSTFINPEFFFTHTEVNECSIERMNVDLCNDKHLGKGTVLIHREHNLILIKLIVFVVDEYNKKGMGYKIMSNYYDDKNDYDEKIIAINYTVKE